METGFHGNAAAHGKNMNYHIIIHQLIHAQFMAIRVIFCIDDKRPQGLPEAPVDKPHRVCRQGG